jgi:hypothetical protein
LLALRLTYPEKNRNFNQGGDAMGQVLFKLLLASFGFLLMLGMVLLLSVYAVWASLKWLLTGQKPQVAVVWQRYRDMRKSTAWGRSSGFSSTEDDVVDVEVREVKTAVQKDKLLK